MINDALTLEIFEALMAQDTINPPGNEMRGALCLKEIFDREGIPCEVQDLAITARTSSLALAKARRRWNTADIWIPCPASETGSIRRSGRPKRAISFTGAARAI